MPGCLLRWLLSENSGWLWSQKSFVKTSAVSEVLVLLLPAAERFVSSMVIRDVLLDQPEEFLASQM